MEWNSNAPMELLAHMPARLTKANLETIQAVIDNDKIICSTMLGRDVCGNYAPFCVLCNKSMKTPCAVAYIRMRQAEGIKLEIAASDYQPDADAPVQTVDNGLAEDSVVEDTDELQVEVVELAKVEIIEVDEEDPQPELPKKLIKIATAKRKLNK